MRNNYDKIANYYDVLSRLVFFRSQVKAQISQLQYIPADSHILIAGGGTGWILEEIAKIHPSGLTITYVEISSKMLKLSGKRNTGTNTVNYVQAAIEDFKHIENYNVIITAFLFDNFLAPRIKIVFNQLHVHMTDKGLWLFTDFYKEERKEKKWQRYILKTMYLFFRYIAHVEAQSLIQMEKYFKEAGYHTVTESYYYGRFIRSTVYCKAYCSEHVHEPE